VRYPQAFCLCPAAQASADPLVGYHRPACTISPAHESSARIKQSCFTLRRKHFPKSVFGTLANFRGISHQ
jgi:hypothetical protein